MANATTKAQREKWIARASEIIQMDDDTRMTNFYEAREQLTAEFGISQQSATTALAHAAMRYRAKLFSSTAAAVSLGSMTSAAKQAAARANGKRGGRPRKEAKMTDKNVYNVWASNDQGASTDVANNETFTSQRAAEDAARSEMGSGWTIHVTRNGEEIKQFTIL